MESSNSTNKLGLLDFLVLVLSFYVLIALFVSILFKLPPEITRLLDLTDYLICLVFFIDFCVRFYQAKNKLLFMRWGWIDLVSSIPTVDFLRVGRAFRLIRLIRILRAFRSTKNLIKHVFRNRAEGALTSVAIISLLLVIFSSIAILQVEDDPNSNIKTAEDALWWAYVTITTVGYGDKFPVTTEGRLIACVLMTGGVGVFGTFTAYVASFFVSNKKQDDE